MEKMVDKLFHYIDILTGIVTGGMVLLVFLNVVLRVFFNAGLNWSEELARYLFVFVTYIGSISAMNSSEHLSVDILITRLNKKTQLILYIVSQVIISILMVLLTIGSVRMMTLNSALSTASLNIPFPVLYSVGLFLGISVILIAIRNIYYALTGKKKIGDLVASSQEEEEVIEKKNT